MTLGGVGFTPAVNGGMLSSKKDRPGMTSATHLPLPGRGPVLGGVERLSKRDGSALEALGRSFQGIQWGRSVFGFDCKNGIRLPSGLLRVHIVCCGSDVVSLKQRTLQDVHKCVVLSRNLNRKLVLAIGNDT